MDVIGNKNLKKLWQEMSTLYKDKTFLIFENREGAVTRYSYELFNEMINRISSGFLDLGIKKGDKVVIHLFNSPEFLLCWFGLAKIGAVIVPDNAANTLNEAEYVLNYSDAVAVVTEPVFLPMFQQLIACKCPQVRHLILARTEIAVEGTMLLQDLLRGGSPNEPEVEINYTDELEIIFTSGTTSRPKGVVLTHANALRSGLRGAILMAMRPDDRMLTAMPSFHVNCQSFSILAPLTTGATAIILEQYSASKFWRQVIQHKATITSIIAAHVRTLLAQPTRPDETDHCLREVLYAINVTDTEKELFTSRFLVRWMNGYGLSECMTAVTFDPIYGHRKWPSVGLPVIDREVAILDEINQELPPGKVGEICVRGIPGITIMKEYYKDPEATEHALRGGWLHTGDHGYMDADGYLYFFDRKKDMIKRAGENVSAVEVELVLMEHPEIKEVAVIGVPDPIRDEAIKAFVTLEEGSNIKETAIIEYCKGKLAYFKVPSFIEILQEFPRTSIGKIEKKKLRQMETERKKG